MKSLRGNKFFKVLVLCAILLFATIAYVVIRSTATVSAVVPSQAIAAGIKIEESMLKTVPVPVDTPKGYIIDKSSLVGQKLKVSVVDNQLLYISDVMSSWDDFNDGKAIPGDYIVTSIQLPSNRAVGGLITAGDTVDVIGVPNSDYNTVAKETLDNYLGNIAKGSYSANGMGIYPILANVKILETDSTLSQNTGASISSVTKDKGNTNEGSFYIVSLSYSDYKKLLLAQQYLDLHMNIAPIQNGENPPLIDDMNDGIVKELQDSQTQSKMPEVDNQPKAKAKGKSK